MSQPETIRPLATLMDGCTDLVFDLLEAGFGADWQDERGVSLLEHCAYYGDGSALRLLLAKGARLEALGGDLGLGTAAYHGHWRLCQFLLERGAPVNLAGDDTGETALSWASWYNRPTPVLRELLYGNFRIHQQNQSMKANLLGIPHEE